MSDVPKYPLLERTALFDRARQCNVAWVDGLVVLPIGSVVELSDPDAEDADKNVDALVVAVRLFLPATGNAASVTLDLDVPEAFYGRS